MKPVVLIPVYNHPHAVGQVVADIRSLGLACLLVDDGSDEACAVVLDRLAASTPDSVYLLRLTSNQGKGAAVMAGMREAARHGFTHAVQIDADGQHRACDVERFVDLARQYPNAVIAGYPRYDDSVPRHRYLARYATHIWVWINTLSLAIRDSMCGLRVYPLAPTLRLLADVRIGRRMEFDTEILVRLYWRGVAVANLETPVHYPRDGVSHFRPWRDNARISLMHARLFFGMIIRAPMLLRRSWRNG